MCFLSNELWPPFNTKLSCVFLPSSAAMAGYGNGYGASFRDLELLMDRNLHRAFGGSPLHAQAASASHVNSAAFGEERIVLGDEKTVEDSEDVAGVVSFMCLSRHDLRAVRIIFRVAA